MQGITPESCVSRGMLSTKGVFSEERGGVKIEKGNSGSGAV
jgi:hypothetical protein